MAVIERDPLGRIHDLAKYLREPAWTEEGIRLVGAQIQEHVAQAREQHRGAVSGVVAWLREQATGERTEDPGSDQIELIADFIERAHPDLGGQ
jgi:hypothetical protein